MYIRRLVNETYRADKEALDLHLRESGTIERREDHSSKSWKCPKRIGVDKPDSVGLFNSVVEGLPAGSGSGVD
jgi:hypothetical protein